REGNQHAIATERDKRPQRQLERFASLKSSQAKKKEHELSFKCSHAIHAGIAQRTAIAHFVREMAEIAVTHCAVVAFVYRENREAHQQDKNLDLFYFFDHAQNHDKYNEHDHIVFPVGKTRIADG